ncbi:MAG: hypothetical protein ACRC7G_09050 [Beijerinckiaceae bacterium]
MTVGSSPTLFLRHFLLLATGLLAAAAAFLFFLDPYGISPLNAGRPRPIMDINQRYMYPQIVRSGRFDSVVIGTSTSRLLDPRQLEEAFGGRFANLAMNAGTAWEQTEMAKLFLGATPSPRTFILGVDQMWCLEGESIPKITERGFPERFYDGSRWNDLPETINLKTLEIAGRLVGYHFGLMPERIRHDGFEVFTPPEETYDLARARFHIWRDRPEGRVIPVVPPVILSESQRAGLSFPALAWLDETLARLPGETRRMLVFMPLHVSAQPTPGSRAAASATECKRRIDGIARRHGAKVIDFALPSPITMRDDNYWDPLHYRLPIAVRIVTGLARAAGGAGDAPDGSYKVR